MAEPSMTFSSILSRYAPSGGGTSGAPAPAPRSNPPPSTGTASKPLPHSRITTVGLSRPSSVSTTGPNNNNNSGSNNNGNDNSGNRPSYSSFLLSGATNAKPVMSATGNAPKQDNGSAIKRRKVDGLAGSSKPMSQAERETQERKKMLLEKMRLKKEKVAAMAGPVVRGSSVPSKGAAPQQSGSSSARPSKPTPSGGPGYRASAPASAPVGEAKPMSYKEKLAMAAKLQEEKKKLGAITHKPRALVVEKKEYLKRLEARQQTKGSGADTGASTGASGGAAADRKSRSPGISGGERSGAAASKKATGKETTKAGLSRKAVGGSEGRRSSLSKGKPTDKARPAEVPVKRKRSPSPISWRGRNPKAPSTTKANRSRAGRGRYDEDEDEDDDWIVDDDESEDGRRGGSYGKQYRYAESDYESDSDMEAAGLDILEEEEKSRQRAIKEDMEQEKLEKQLAARKAALKKRVGK